jgi:hypothetical protein
MCHQVWERHGRVLHAEPEGWMPPNSSKRFTRFSVGQRNSKRGSIGWPCIRFKLYTLGDLILTSSISWRLVDFPIGWVSQRGRSKSVLTIPEGIGRQPAGQVEGEQ